MKQVLTGNPFSRFVTLALAALVAWPAVAAPRAPGGPRNFDAREAANRRVSLAPVPGQERAIARLRAEIPELRAEIDRTTGATRVLSNPTGYLTAAPRAGDATAAALTFVEENLALLGLGAADLAEYEITDTVFSRVSGATHLYLRQMFAGLPVYNGQLQVHVNREGRILGVANAFLPDLAGAVNATEPAVGAGRAVAAAAAHLGIPLAGLPREVDEPRGAQRVTRVEAEGLSLEPIEARLALLPVRRGVARLVWSFQIHTVDSEHVYDFTVDAADGRVWTRFDWVAADSYRVYAQPAESPNHVTPLPPADGRTLVVDPADATASPFAWHDTNGSPGAEFTNMRGNNVHAYDDRDANNAPPASEPSCGASLACDFPINLSQDPSQYIPAAVANLFYWNNVVHDVQYRYGFDEAGGNFQVNNYGNGGAGGDDVRAEAQDGGGTNNANFFTPADGSRPRMQMYLWTAPNPDKDGDLDNGIIVHEYGHGISNRQVGGPSNVSCLGNTQQPGEGWSDWLALAYTGEVGDQGTDVRGIGTYALDQPTSGTGIRTQPYSTDLAVNTWTYATISTGVAVPHGVGAVWAQGIWEVYWALVDAYGFDPDLYNALGGAGNQRAMLYVNEGLKNTACSPTFLNARDGIIQAAVDNYGGADVCLLWSAFAAYGLGTDATTGGPNSLSATNGFQVPAECQCSPQPVADAGPDRTICLGESTTVGTPAQSGHTYGWSQGGATTAQITVGPSVTTTYTVTATTACGSAQDSVTVTVDDGSGGGLDEDFEGGLGSWTTGGLWHLVSNSSCASPGYSSPVNALYYGQDSTCNYSTGGSNSGDLISPTIAGINAASALTFDYFRQVESYNGDYDRTQVAVSSDGGSTWSTVWSRNASNPSENAWTSSGAISLAAFDGQQIRLRFRFDTVDGVSNAFTGWLVDDVVVTADSACTPGNTPPAVDITAPPNGSSFLEGTSIAFSGTATDAEDGDLTAGLAWTSSLDGAIGSGGSFSATLSVGTHTVTASVTDSGSLSGSDQITVTVNPNTPPVVTITAPPDGSSFAEGTSIAFSGTATDAEDGTLTGSLSWTSSLDGAIGSGGSFSAVLSVGVHTVTASVTDSGGLSGSDQITVTVNASGGCNPLDFNTLALTAYSNQDGSGSVVVEDAGATLFMTGNRWRRTVSTFTLAADTVLEFDFRSTSQGEIHGIGFDQDDTLNDEKVIFQLFGTQNWTNSWKVADPYTTGQLGTWRSFRLRVGEYYTGAGYRLVFVNDKDSGTLNNTSRFRNVKVCADTNAVTPLDFNLVGTSAYSNQDTSNGSIAVEDGGLTFFMTGNRWRQTNTTYAVTPNTVLAFEFMSTSQGEIHAIGFDENSTLTDAQRVFRIFGTQNWSGDIDWSDPYTTGQLGTWKSFSIPVGTFYTGSSMRLILVNDKDSGTANNTSRFRSVRIFEQP